MKWDKKLALYLMLCYFIYALSNSFTLGDFVPPLPLFPFLIPFLGLIYCIRTTVTINSLLMMTISFGVPIHMLIFLHPLLINIMSLLALFSMVLAGILMARHFYINHKKPYNFIWSIIMMASPILILDNKWIMFGYFILLGAATLICLKSITFNYSNAVPEYRILLLIGFICALYSINFVSLVSLDLIH